MKVSDKQQFQLLKEIFVLAKSKCNTPETWTKSWSARDDGNLACNPVSRDAEKFSLDGALLNTLYVKGYEPDSDIYKQTLALVGSAIKSDPTRTKILAWNDDSTHKEVLAIFDKILSFLDRKLEKS